jgi:AcrR family transcriptional regulator
MTPLAYGSGSPLDSLPEPLYIDCIVNDSLVSDSMEIQPILMSRKEKKEQTRKTLIQVALREFGQRGIMATRISDIARAAGVSHGTVFAHFETQEAFIVAVIQEFGWTTAQRMHELARGRADVREVLQAHLTGIAECEAFYARLVMEARLLPRPARDTLIAIQSAISFHISQAAQREMDAGTILVMPIPLLFNTWMGLVNYYLANADLFAPEGSVIEQYGPVLLDHYMRLISVQGAVKP